MREPCTALQLSYQTVPWSVELQVTRGLADNLASLHPGPASAYNKGCNNIHGAARMGTQQPAAASRHPFTCAR